MQEASARKVRKERNKRKNNIDSSLTLFRIKIGNVPFSGILHIREISSRGAVLWPMLLPMQIANGGAALWPK